jgi:hypothetical protein
MAALRTDSLVARAAAANRLARSAGGFGAPICRGWPNRYRPASTCSRGAGHDELAPPRHGRARWRRSCRSRRRSHGDNACPRRPAPAAPTRSSSRRPGATVATACHEAKFAIRSDRPGASESMASTNSRNAARRQPCCDSRAWQQGDTARTAARSAARHRSTTGHACRYQVLDVLRTPWVRSMRPDTGLRTKKGWPT